MISLLENFLKFGKRINTKLNKRIKGIALDLVYRSIRRYVANDPCVLDSIRLFSDKPPMQSYNVTLQGGLLAFYDAIFTFVESTTRQHHVTMENCVEVVRNIVKTHKPDATLYNEELRWIVHQIHKQFPCVLEYVYLNEQHLITNQLTDIMFATEAITPAIKKIYPTTKYGLSANNVRKFWSVMINFGYRKDLIVTRFTPTEQYTKPIQRIFHKHISGYSTILATLSITTIVHVWLAISRMYSPGIFITITLCIVSIVIGLSKAVDHIVDEQDRLFEYTNYDIVYHDIVRTLTIKEVEYIAKQIGFSLYEEDGDL